MQKLVLGIVLEVIVAVFIAGLILALAIPLLNRGGLIGAGDAAARIIMIGVLLLTVAVALFRPGSAIQRYIKR